MNELFPLICREVPPYYTIGLFFLDAFTIPLNWVATINYAYLLAPPDLVATMTSVVNVLAYILGLAKQTHYRIRLFFVCGVALRSMMTIFSFSYCSAPFSTATVLDR